MGKSIDLKLKLKNHVRSVNLVAPYWKNTPKKYQEKEGVVALNNMDETDLQINVLTINGMIKRSLLKKGIYYADKEQADKEKSGFFVPKTHFKIYEIIDKSSIELQKIENQL